MLKLISLVPVRAVWRRSQIPYSEVAYGSPDSP